MDKDARALFKAAGSIKRLDLRVEGSCTSDSLAEVFDYRPLEKLELTFYSGIEVSSACSPAWYIVMWCGL